MEAALRFVHFLERARAQENFSRLKGQLPSSAWETLPRLLAHLPDPDTALNNLERFIAAAPPEVREFVGKSRPALDHLLVLFSYSPYLSDTLIQQPALVTWLEQEPALHRVKTCEELLHGLDSFAAGPSQAGADLSALLARYKRREYLRIVLRDVLRLATLPEVALELSALADAILHYALARAREELAESCGLPMTPMIPANGGGAAGHPPGGGGGSKECPVAVLSLGKLGGNELNYSSTLT